MDNNFDINQFSAKLKEEAEKMQSRLQETQKQLTDMRVTGKAGGGMVSIVMNGRHDVTQVKINPALHDEDLKIVEELIAAAINDAVKQVDGVEDIISVNGAALLKKNDSTGKLDAIKIT
jgi:DNA-binding YbaB/EbfC family protein